MNEKAHFSLAFPTYQPLQWSMFLLNLLILLGSICLASAGASTRVPSNWNRYARASAGHAPTQTFAYLVSENIDRRTANGQVVPVLSFACMDKHLSAQIFFNQFHIKQIKHIDLKADSTSLSVTSWMISRADRSIIYTSNVPALMHSLYGHHTLRMQLVGQSGRIIYATFDINLIRLGTSAVRKACQHTDN